MKFKSVVLSLASFVTLSVGLALPGFANVIGETARLVTHDSGSQVNVRSAPTTQSASPHYGFAGDRVVVLSEAEGADGYIWYYIRFQGSQAEGWIRGDFVVLEVATH